MMFADLKHTTKLIVSFETMRAVPRVQYEHGKPSGNHKTFGNVELFSTRLTSGENHVVEAHCADGQTRILLTDGRYWNSKEDSNAIQG